MHSKTAAVHVREFLADSLTPLAVYRRLAKISKVRFLLESVSGGEQVSRFSFLGAGPREIYRLWPDRLDVSDASGGGAGKTETLPGKPLDALRRELRRVRSEPGPIPFTGGLVGFFGYDLVRMIEHLPGRPDDHFGLPTAVFGRFDTVVVFDHAQQRVLAIANEIEDEVTMAEAEDSLRKLSKILTSDGGTRAVAMPEERRRQKAPTSRVSMSGEDYRAAVEKAKEYIRAGDIFQVVIGRRWTVPEAPRQTSQLPRRRVNWCSRDATGVNSRLAASRARRKRFSVRRPLWKNRWVQDTQPTPMLSAPITS